MNNLEFLVKNYQTPPEAITLVENSRILLLAGISGAGKDTTKKHLLKNEEYRDIVSHTTRQPRENNGKIEQNGVDYNFISIEKAEEMLRNRKFIEAKFVHGRIYGTSVAEIEKANQNGQISVTDIDIPSAEEFEKDFEKRLPEAISSLEQALEVPYFHFILNDDFRNTARIINQIMHQDVEFNYKDIEVRVRARKLLEDIKAKFLELSK